MATVKVVNGLVLRADGTPRANVLVRAKLSIPATIAGAQEVVPLEVTTRTAGDGTYSLSLFSNSDLTPANTYYTITEDAQSGDSYPFTIVVPGTAGPFSAASIQTGTPAQGVYGGHVSTLTVDNRLTLSADFIHSHRIATEAELVSGLDASLAETVVVTLTANRVMGVPINGVDGHRMKVVFIEGGAGGFTVDTSALSVTNWALNLAVGKSTELPIERIAGVWVLAVNPSSAVAGTVSTPVGGATLTGGGIATSPPLGMVWLAQDPQFGGAIAGDWGIAIRAAITKGGAQSVIFVGGGVFNVTSVDGNGNALTLPNLASRLAGAGKGATTIRVAVAVTWGIQLQAAQSSVVDLELDATTSGSMTYGVGIDTPSSPGSAEECFFENVLVQKILSGACTNAFAVGPGHPGASNIDIAYTQFYNCSARGQSNAGFVLGNGTGSNILNTHLSGCVVASGSYGVYCNQTNFSWVDGDVIQNTICNFKVTNNNGKNILIQGVESETSAQLFAMQGVGSSTSIIRLSDITFSADAIIPAGDFLDLNSAVSFILEAITVINNGAVVPFILTGAGATPQSIVCIGCACSTPLWAGPAGPALFSLAPCKLVITVIGYTQMGAGGVAPQVAVVGGPVRLVGTNDTYNYNGGGGRDIAGPTEKFTLSGAGAVAMQGDAEFVEILLQANCTSSTVAQNYAGRRITISPIQDGVGSRSFVWPARCKFAGGAAPVTSTGANLRDSVTFEDDGTNLRELSRAVGVAA